MASQHSENSDIPYLAKGGTVLSGSAIVGEAGPELLTVGPSGTRVQPLTNTGGSKSVTPVAIGEMNFYGYTPQQGRRWRGKSTGNWGGCLYETV